MKSAEYVTRARLAPAATAVGPIVLLAVALGIPLDAWNQVWPVFGFAILVVAVEMGRDSGKRLEPGLWETWGGAPTTALLRYRGSTNAEMTAMWHSDVSKATGIELPSADEEVNDPDAADLVYATATARVISLTRDSKKFPILFAENVSYGFRRNCLGLRSLAIVVCVLTLGSVLAATGYRVSSHETSALPSLMVPTVVALVALVWWWRVVRPDWVRGAADSYARRLMEAAGQD
jgi:hypothetical protein